MTLAPCPCGKAPDSLTIVPSNGYKHAFAVGDCCGEWHIEFRTNYALLDSPECMALAQEAWNDAPRGDEAMTFKLTLEQRQRAEQLVEHGMDDPDAVSYELIYLRDEVELLRKALAPAMNEKQAVYDPRTITGPASRDLRKPETPDRAVDKPSALGAAIDDVEGAVARFRTLRQRIIDSAQKDVTEPVVACAPMPLATLLNQAPQVLREKTHALLALAEDIESLLFPFPPEKGL